MAKMKRWTNAPRPRTAPPGHMSGGIKDAEIFQLFGETCTRWPHLEVEMIKVMGLLLNLQHGNLDTAGLVFAAIINQKARIDVMRNLLERSRGNRDKPKEFDEVLTEFKKLNDLRNDYIHGRWWSHDSGDTYLQPDNSDSPFKNEYRKVTKKELKEFSDRLNKLYYQLTFVI